MRTVRFAVSLAALLLASTALAQEAIRVEPGDGAQERLQEALILAEPGQVVELAAGRFELTDGLALDVPGVTVRGVGMERTVLSFAGQQGGGEGLFVSSDDVVLEDFAVEDTKGDGIKAKGVDGITFRRVRVEWTGGPLATNGAYGLYPVEATNVLIDGVVVRGASDAGIYVGQSQDIVVRNSLAEFNVAGIEIENSYRPTSTTTWRPATRAASWCSTCPTFHSRAGTTSASSAIGRSTTTRRTSRRKATSSGWCRPAPAS